MMTNKDQRGIYIHIPFCAKKCVYCDFLSAPETDAVMKSYFDALRREIRLAAREAAGDGTFATVFFGGGTPGLPEAPYIADVLGEIRNCFDLSADAEITLETNPGLVSREKLAVYREAGVNRLSMGAQSMDDRELKLLGRIHTGRDIREGVALARQAGFENLNLDLMEALPGQTPGQLEKNLTALTALSPEHISVYSLILEDGTYLAKHLKDFPPLPDEDTERTMYWRTVQFLRDKGYEQYEISNFAKPGRFCVHNTSYWERREYIGLGLGASSLRRETRWSNTRNLQQYLKFSSLADIRRNVTALSREDAMAEFFYLGLRKTEGVALSEFQDCFGVPAESVYGSVLSEHEKDGTLAVTNGRLTLTKRGLDVSNYILCDFLK